VFQESREWERVVGSVEVRYSGEVRVAVRDASLGLVVVVSSIGLLVEPWRDEVGVALDLELRADTSIILVGVVTTPRRLKLSSGEFSIV